MELTHYQLCLAKAYWLAPNYEARSRIASALDESAFVNAWNGIVIWADVADLSLDGYRIRVFCDDCAVITGPEGETDRVTAWMPPDRDEEGSPQRLHIERHSDAPAWLTDEVIERLREASLVR